ncbi:MAG: phosphatidate cytidylyltransferase [Syntrophomonadaceae bacterium]|nr:phosphatidate cytidylyltransferase [Syntrophomonadaceae bacterium]
MLKTRIITSIIGIPIILTILYIGGLYWQIFFSVLAVIGLYEYFSMMKNKGHHPLVIEGYLLLLLALGYYLYPDKVIFLLTGIVLLTVLEMIVRYPKVTVQDVSLSFFGAFYIGFLFSFALLINTLAHSFPAIILAFILTWSSDIGGYFAGRLWGKRKLTILLSPNKTWEGALGGVFLSVVTVGLFFLIIDLDFINPAYVLLLGVFSSIVAQLGDLFISGFKRYFGVKDSGRIVPGHGGILDRFDSFMLVVPVIYLFWLNI